MSAGDNHQISPQFSIPNFTNSTALLRLNSTSNSILSRLSLQFEGSTKNKTLKPRLAIHTCSKRRGKNCRKKVIKFGKALAQGHSAFPAIPVKRFLYLAFEVFWANVAAHAHSTCKVHKDHIFVLPMERGHPQNPYPPLKIE